MFGPAHSASRRAEHFLLTSIVNYSQSAFFGQGPPGPLPFKGQRPRQGQSMRYAAPWVSGDHID